MRENVWPLKYLTFSTLLCCEYVQIDTEEFQLGYDTRDDWVMECYSLQATRLAFRVGTQISITAKYNAPRLVGCFIIFIYTRQLTFARASFCKYYSLCTSANSSGQKWAAIEPVVAGRIVDGRCKSARGSQWIVRQLSNWAAKRTRVRDVCGIN